MATRAEKTGILRLVSDLGFRDYPGAGAKVRSLQLLGVARVTLGVTLATKCYQILLSIITEKAPRLDMMYVKIPRGAAVLAVPPISIEYPLPQSSV